MAYSIDLNQGRPGRIYNEKNYSSYEGGGKDVFHGKKQTRAA